MKQCEYPECGCDLQRAAICPGNQTEAHRVIKLPRPEPSAGTLAYEQERLAALALDPRKRTNYNLYQTADRRNVDYLPVKLDIENVSRCNFACTMCIVSTWKHGKRARDMTLEEFKGIIDEQYGLVEIKLNGLGEALMQGDDYFRMIEYARAKRIWVRMTTNASLLHVKNNYKKLIDSGVNEIDISIDGADKQTFESIRVQSKFEQVIKNCKLLNDYTKSLGIVRAKMWTLVQKGNVDGLEQHVLLAAELGFKHFILSTQLHGWGNINLAARNAGEQISVSEERAHKLIDLGELKGVRVAFWNVAEKFDAQHKCPWPFERAVITSDLRTVPCCMIGDPDAYEIGHGGNFTDIWNGDEYAAFRKAHLEGNIPNVCKSCYKGNN